MKERAGLSPCELLHIVSDQYRYIIIRSFIPSFHTHVPFIPFTPGRAVLNNRI